MLHLFPEAIKRGAMAYMVVTFHCKKRKQPYGRIFVEWPEGHPIKDNQDNGGE